MYDDIEHRLHATFTTVRIERELHDVPPHRVYEVQVDGQRAICKQTTGPTGGAEIEGRVMAIVDEHTSVPVPEILAIGDGYFVARWHPDAPSPGSAPDPTNTWATAAGRGLAHLHDQTASLVEHHGRFTIRDDEVTVDGHRSWQAGALAYIDRYRPVLARFGHADMADAARSTLADRPNLFEEAGEPVCCHGWISPEHVGITEDGDLGCVVDFEHALAAPPSFDYWRAVVATFGPGEPTPEQRAFRRGYESVRPLPARVDEQKPVYDILNLIYFFESLYIQAQHDEQETAQRAQHMRHLLKEKLDAL